MLCPVQYIRQPSSSVRPSVVASIRSNKTSRTDRYAWRKQRAAEQEESDEAAE
jgi:hypothetical protein